MAWTTMSAADGTYALALRPGTYQVTATSTGPGRGCAAASATVAPGTTTTTDISCDTGIR